MTLAGDHAHLSELVEGSGSSTFGRRLPSRSHNGAELAVVSDSNDIASPMSASALMASPRAIGHVARRRAIGAPNMITASVLQTPLTAIAHEMTPNVDDTTLTRPNTTNAYAQVRRVLYRDIAASFRLCLMVCPEARHVLHPDRVICAA